MKKSYPEFALGEAAYYNYYGNWKKADKWMNRVLREFPIPQHEGGQDGETSKP